MRPRPAAAAHVTRRAVRRGGLGRVARGLGLVASLGLALAACGGAGTTVNDTALSADSGSNAWTWSLPAFFPVPRVPDVNPMSAAKVELGRHLFYDRRLSGNGTQSCASCHLQALAFTDGRAVSVGATGELTHRNSPSLANSAYNATYTWANPALVTLESQMLTPLFADHPVEMGVHDGNKADVLQRLSDDAAYPDRFLAAFPDDTADAPAGEPTWGRVIQAIASFQRTIISGNSRYDQYLRGQPALNAAEERGMRLFFGEKAECFHCHGSFNFNDQVVHASSRQVLTPFHNTGLYNIDGQGAFPEPNRGVFELTGKPSDMGKFRAPTLRNVAVTAPYMHDGSVPTLEAVLDIYAAGGRNIVSGPHAGDGRANPYKNPLITRIDLTEQDKADLVAFLKALTDDGFLSDPRWSDPFAAAAAASSPSP